jgi:predicted outer membrane repeat protein
LENVSLSGNQAASGGGLYNNANSFATLTGVDILSNTVSTNGGGVYNNGTFTLTNSTVSGNQALDGGGMYNNTTGTAILTNVNTLGNQAGTNGGGVFSRGAFTLTNSTISGNQALSSGGGAHLSNSSALLQNAILWNNQDSSGTGTLTSTISTANATPNVRYSDLQGCGGSDAWDAACGIDGGDNIDADPLFLVPVDPASAPTMDGDLHVQGSSPVIDAGDDGVCPSTDLDGYSRPLGAACDQGAYEFSGGVIVDAGSDQIVDEGQSVQFVGIFTNTASLFSPTAGESYHWDFGDGNTITGTLMPAHTYIDDGSYTVTLTVTNTQGSTGSDSLLVVVNNVLPQLSEFPDQTGWAGELITVTGTITDPGILDTQTVFITWADGGTTMLNLGATERHFTATHAYASAGQYPVGVVVVDKDDGTDQASFSLTVWMKFFHPIFIYGP